MTTAITIINKQNSTRLLAVFGLLAIIGGCGGAANSQERGSGEKPPQSLVATAKPKKDKSALEAVPARCGPKIQYYSVTHYELTALAFDEVAPAALETETGPVLWQNFGLKLLASKQLSSHKPSSMGLSFSLFNRATACPQSFYSALQNVVDISIVSNELFSPQYPAGSDLSAVFSPSYLYATNNIDPPDLPETLTELLNTPQLSLAPQQLELRLNQAPSFQFHTFTITLTLDDGNQLTASSEPIEFRQ